MQAHTHRGGHIDPKELSGIHLDNLIAAQDQEQVRYDPKWREHSFTIGSLIQYYMKEKGGGYQRRFRSAVNDDEVTVIEREIKEYSLKQWWRSIVYCEKREADFRGKKTQAQRREELKTPTAFWERVETIMRSICHPPLFLQGRFASVLSPLS